MYDFIDPDIHYVKPKPFKAKVLTIKEGGADEKQLRKAMKEHGGRPATASELLKYGSTHRLPLTTFDKEKDVFAATYDGRRLISLVPKLSADEEFIEGTRFLCVLY